MSITQFLLSCTLCESSFFSSLFYFSSISRRFYGSFRLLFFRCCSRCRCRRRRRLSMNVCIGVCVTSWLVIWTFEYISIFSYLLLICCRWNIYRKKTAHTTHTPYTLWTWAVTLMYAFEPVYANILCVCVCKCSAINCLCTHTLCCWQCE